MDNKFIKFRAPFTSMIAGSTGSGKTFLTRNILSCWKDSFYGIEDDILKVYWCYGQYQDLYNEPIGSDVNVVYRKGLISSEEIETIRPHLIVIDDLMNELSNSLELSNLFTKYSHHLNVSVIFILQNFYVKGNEIRNISLNSHYIALMKNVRDKRQVQILGRQLYPEKSKYQQFISAYEKATSKEYGYLLIDLKTNTPEKYRLRSRVTTQDLPINIRHYKYAPIIYLIR